MVLLSREKKGKVKPVYSASEYEALALRAQKGDKKARDDIVLTLKPLIFATIRRAAPHAFRLLPEDLLQEGYIGVLKAIDRFRSGAGASFITYATIWIRCSAYAFLQTMPILNVPCNTTNSKAYWRACEDIGDEQLAAETGVSLALVRSVRAAFLRPLEIAEAFAEEDDETRRLRHYPTEDPWPAIEQQIAAKESMQAVEQLSTRLRKILLARVSGESLKDVGSKNRHISRERVRQLEKRAVETLRVQLDRPG